MKIQKISLMVLPMLFAAGAALAQAPQSTIRESTDPGRVAEVERRAEALRRGQPSDASSGMQPGMRGNMAGEGGHHMHGHEMGRHHKDMKHHHRAHHGHRGDHPKAAPASGGPAK